MTYLLQPIDTTRVEFSPDIQEPTEKLAENTHEILVGVAVGGGLNDGFRRDDQRKTHPCLVPYANLPDGEKQYDRNTAMESLKAIVSLGYRIEKRRSA